MRTILPQQLIDGRIRTGFYGSTEAEGFNGAFQIYCPQSATHLRIIASDGIDPMCERWEHVSVSTSRDRIPNWVEMSFVKDLFWTEEECVAQFHPPKSKYINFHPHVLHLWRRRGQEFELPPPILIGPKEGQY